MIQRVTVPTIKDWGGHNCHVVRAGQDVWVSGVVGMTANGEVPSGMTAHCN